MTLDLGTLDYDADIRPYLASLGLGILTEPTLERAAQYRNAADVIRQGYTRDAYARDRHGSWVNFAGRDAVAWCALGAFYKATAELGSEPDELRAYLGKQHGKNSIGDWSDVYVHNAYRGQEGAYIAAVYEMIADAIENAVHPTLSDLQQDILLYLHDHDIAPAFHIEQALWMYTPASIRSRLKELERLGFVSRTNFRCATPTGRTAGTWTLTPTGCSLV